MLNATEIIKAAKEFMDGVEWKYDYQEEKNLIVTGGAIKNSVKSVNIIITAREGILQTFTAPSVKADVNNSAELLKFLNWANWNMTSGSFALDSTDGEIRFRYTVRLGSADMLPKDVVEGAVLIPVMMYERYGEAIATLASGKSDAVSEIRKIMENNKR